MHCNVVASQIPWACAVELISISHRLTSLLYGGCVCVPNSDTLPRNVVTLSHILSAVAVNALCPIQMKLCLLLNRLQIGWSHLKPLCRRLQLAHVIYSRFLTFYKSEIKYFTCNIRKGLSIITTEQLTHRNLGQQNLGQDSYNTINIPKQSKGTPHICYRTQSPLC